jgi:hypothetical protein
MTNTPHIQATGFRRVALVAALVATTVGLVPADASVIRTGSATQLADGGSKWTPGGGCSGGC